MKINEKENNQQVEEKEVEVVEQKKERKNKKRLILLLLLLLVTGFLLTTSTYAWFTANKRVTVDDITVNVSTSTGLTISTDASNWKTVIKNTDITSPTSYAANTNQFPNTEAGSINPVSTAGEVDDAGRLNMYLGTVGSTDGIFTLTATKETETKGSTGNFIAFDMFLRAEAGGAVYLSKDSSVKIVGDTDSGLENAARVAFVKEGETSVTSSIATMQGLVAPNTTDVVVWEPNYDAHTQAGVNNASDPYGVTTLTAGTGNAQVSYSGIKDVVTNPVALGDATQAKDATKFKDVTTLPTLTTPTSGTQIFTLAAGVTKFRVYMWVEGQDVDCENNASGYEIVYNMSFSLEND